MHWLRDLMREGPTPVGSLGELARRALVHPAWPADSRPQARSLAALLSKLDRGLELDWLGDRPEIQQILADVLGTPRSRITSVVGGGQTQADHEQGRVRFTDIPFASPLDLRLESLPPGIPGKILRPVEWDGGVWWVASRGAGRTLAGRWLAARSLAAFISAPDWESARAKIPDSGPVLVELTGMGTGAAIAPPRPNVCIAAPFRPDPGFDEIWNFVESAPPATWLEPLVTWLARRLPRDGHFEPKNALDWLKRAADEGLVDGLGSAIGLAGLIDEHGAEELTRLGMARVMERFVRDRLAKSGAREGRDTAWLEKNGAKIVLGIARRMLASESDAWDAARTEPQWMSLVPEEYRESVDTEWLRLSLSRAAGPSTVKDVEKALRDLPPGAFRVVRALSQAGLLEPEGPEALALGPAWLARFVHQRARLATLRGAPQEWGEALLSRDAAWVVRGVIARVLDGDVAVLEDVLDPENPRDPAAIAALELAFRAAGIAVLGGVLDVPDDLRLALWDQQMAGVVERADGPHPRVSFGKDDAGADPLLDVGTFRLAALALSEGLPASRGKSHALLRPWLKHPERATLGLLADSVARAAARFDWREHPWMAGAFELFDRLALTNPESHAAVAENELFAVEWPAELLRRVTAGTLDWSTVRRAGKNTVPGLLALGARANVESRAVARSLWMAWLEAPDEVDENSPLSPASTEAPLLYAAAPAEALIVLFGRGLVDVRRVPYSVFDADQWSAVIQTSPGGLRGATEAFQVMPTEVTRAALGRLTLAPEEGAVVWRREPGIALDALSDAIVLDAERALALLAAAPSERSGRICEKLEELQALLPEALRHEDVRAWLHDCVARRADGFRTAVALLDRAR